MGSGREGRAGARFRLVRVSQRNSSGEGEAKRMGDAKKMPHMPGGASGA